MAEDRNAKTQLIVEDITAKIKSQNEIIGFNTTSILQPRLDDVSELIDAYNPSIQGLDSKIVSIGQSINQLKDEIITLVTNAVGTSTEFYCGIASTGPGGRCFVSTDGGDDGGWAGGISTCLDGYTSEYYDTVTSRIWAFSSTSSNPFVPSAKILSSATNTFGVGVGTFLFVTQSNSSYSAGARVSLGSSSSCQATQTEIDRKDGEISVLRSEITGWVSVRNKVSQERTTYELQKWGLERSQTQAQEEKDRLAGVLTAFNDSLYSNQFIKPETADPTVDQTVQDTDVPSDSPAGVGTGGVGVASTSLRLQIQYNNVNVGLAITTLNFEGIGISSVQTDSLLGITTVTADGDTDGGNF